MVKEYYLDRTRRPPILKGKLETIKIELSNRFEVDKLLIEDLQQNELLDYVSNRTRESLDRHNPLNSGNKLTKKIYRFIMSKKTKKLQKLMRKAHDMYHASKRNKSKSPEAIDKLWTDFKSKRNTYNRAVRDDRRKYDSSKLYDGIENASSVWNILKKFNPVPDLSEPKPVVSINGKSGEILANHMVHFFAKRAKLVSDDDALQYIDMVPYPKDKNDIQIEIDSNHVYKVEELFEGKKKPSLAAGPDSISHEHVCDLLPVIGPVLQKAIDKPLDKFPDIRRNFTRLLNKEKKPGALFTEKSQRPIAELNIIPKYAAIKVFVDQLREQILHLLNDNQFAFPGKGGPMAIVSILDFFACHARKRSKAALILWDFSNAFCTTIHYLTMQIANKYNLSDRTIRLLKQFLEQTLSTIKMSDRNGVYFSDETDMIRGSCQGQIGSDLIFSLINDKMQPKLIFNEIIKRVKYVDDFTDAIVADSSETLFQSLKSNEQLLVAQATSVGLKINATKLKVLVANIPEKDVPEEYTRRGDDLILVKQESLLGFAFEVINPNKCDAKYSKPSYLSGNRAAKNTIARLNESVRVICALRKVSVNIEKKVTAATSLVFSNCYDIGLVYAYADKKHFDSVVIAI